MAPATFVRGAASFTGYAPLFFRIHGGKAAVAAAFAVILGITTIAGHTTFAAGCGMLL
jgi:hypothetical protein